MCLHERTHCCHLANTTEPSVYGCDVPYVTFDHLSLDTPTQTVAQIYLCDCRPALRAQYCIVAFESTHYSYLI